MIRKLLIGANFGVPLFWAATGFGLPGFAALFVTHMLTLYATLVPGCRWWGPVQTRHGGGGVWITVDDGPDGEHTRSAMDLLEQRGARATFFFIGERADREPELLAEVRERGHGVGNHTLTHPAGSFWRLGPRRLAGEIGGGLPSHLFRAPAGMRNPFVHPILKRHGMRLVAWSARGYDGRDTDIGKIVDRIAKRLAPGAIVLLHESRRTPEGGSLLLETLPRVLDEIGRRGLEVEVEDLDC